MQHVNDDMDDLVRRAAKEYPLNTNSGQWEKIADALHNKDFYPPTENKNGRRKLFWFLLLIPCLLYHQHNTRTGSLIGNKQANVVLTQRDVAGKNEPNLLQQSTTINNLQKPSLA